MKKGIFFKSIISVIIVALLAVCSFFGVSNTNQVVADEEEREVITLDKDITNKELSKLIFDKTNYIFNGNGYTVTLEDALAHNVSLFNDLINVEVYNLKIKGVNIITTHKTQLGVLATTIKNSVIRGIEFEDCYIEIRNEEEIPLLETGFVAGRISNSVIDQISVRNCKVILNTSKYIQEDEFGNIISEGDHKDNNINVGYIAGSLIEGASITNSMISSCVMELLEFKNELSQANNIGGLVGYMEAGSIINNIVEFNKDEIQLDSEVKKSISVGGLAGTVNNDIIEIYNNIICYDNAITYNEDSIVPSMGIVIGKLNKQIDASRIEGVLTTSNEVLIGNKLNADVVTKHKKINVIERKKIDGGIFADSSYVTYWKEEGNTKWNFVSVWLKSTLNNLPSLQIFNIYSTTFSVKESLETLKLETLPTLESGDIIDFYFERGGVDSLFEQNDITYGSTFSINLNVTSEKNFDEFFSISGLRINGELVYSVGDEHPDIKLESDIDEETGKIEPGNVTFTISNFVAGYAGVYSVELTPNIFNINIEVLEITDEYENKIMPGKVKNNLAVESFEKINNIEMQYGYKYTYETVVTNTDYSEIAEWYLVDINTDSYILDGFDHKNAVTQFEATKRFTWTFNENSELFTTKNGATAYDVHSGHDYTLFVVFPQTVKTLEISFKNADGEIIKEKIANISIDGDDSRIIWNEETHLYTAKVAYDRKEHVIKIEMLDTKYEFIAWYEGVDSVLSVEMEGTMTGVFKVATSGNMDEDLSETLLLHCRVNKHKSQASLLWLWITLGVLGVAGLVVVIIIIIKKRRGGGGRGNSTSYKKQFYY